MTESSPPPSHPLPLPVAATAGPRWPTALVVLLLALVVYLPAALGAELLRFDDNFFFGPENPEFQAGLSAVWTHAIANAYLPVAHTSLWFDWYLGDGGALLPHLHNLLLHAAAAFVLVRLLLQLGVSFAVANVAAALFVVHPALCESVAWVSSRKYVLSGLFVFLSLLQAVRYARAPSPRRLLLVALFAAAAMYSNATAVVLPLLAVVAMAWCGGPRARWWTVLVLVSVIAPIALHHQAVAAEQGTMVGGDLASRLPQAPGAFWHYLRTAVWPTGLNVLYPEVDTLAAFRRDALPGTIAFAATALLAAVLWWGRRTRAIGAGLAAFAIALVPFNTVWPASSIAAADRYLYLAIPGLALALAAAARLLHRRGPWFAAACVVPLVWLAAGRAHDFRSDARLWQASLDADANNAVAHLNFVEQLLRQRIVAYDDVVQHLEAAVKAARYPVHELNARQLLRRLALADADYEAAARHALAAVRAAEQQLALETTERRRQQAAQLLLQARLAAFEPLQLHGDDAAARAQIEAARVEAPEHPEVIAFDAMQQLRELQSELMELVAKGKEPRLARDDPRAVAARARLEAALSQHPDNPELWLAMALWCRVQDDVIPALRAFKKATSLRGDLVQAWLGAARMMRERGEYGIALDYAQKGFARREDPRLLQEAALALVGLNRLDEAELQLAAYVRLRPDDQDSKRILANLLIGRAYTLLADQNRRGEVRKLVAEALRLNPDETKAHLVLGRLLHEERRFRSAVEHLEKAHALLPDFADAREHLARSLAALGFAELLQGNEEAATDAWLRCLEVAPDDFDREPIENQLQLAWTRIEARGVERFSEGDRDGAIADFRRLLRIDPEQHWACWLLATALRDRADVDLDELEQLCRKAVAWQRQHELDPSRQVYLLAHTLQRRGKADEARRLVEDYLSAPFPEAEPAVLAALKSLTGGD